MKFLELVKMLKAKEENRGVIVLVKCGAFFVGVAEDALWASATLNLKRTCITNRMCKIGIPINCIYEYIDKLERTGYSFVIYNYSKEVYLEGTNKYEEAYRYEGKKLDYTKLPIECEKCDYYKAHRDFDNINLFDNLKKIQEEKEKLKNGS